MTAKKKAMSKYEYLYRVESWDKYESQKKSVRNVWATNKAAIKKEYKGTEHIHSCERVLDENGKPMKRGIE